MLTLYIADVERDAGMKNLSREEAAKVLEGMKVKIEIPKAAVTQWELNAALDMAIEVLNCSEIPNKSDTISRQAAIDAFEKECTQDESYGYIDIKSAVDVLNDLPSVKLATDLQFLQPESEYVFYDSDHGFCINTQDVLDYLRKELRNG